MKTCIHCKGGCSIYNKRPKVCADFQCAWSLGDFSEEMRPDKVGFMVERLPDESVVFVTIIDDTLITEKPEIIFKEYLDHGISVISQKGFALLAPDASVINVRKALKSSLITMGFDI